MKKVRLFSVLTVLALVSGAMYLSAYVPDAYAATQRFYADPDNDGHGTAGDYIVREDTERPPDGYIDWTEGHYNDNCPNVYNPDQHDANSNGIGDVCDTNTDPVISLLDIDLNKIALVQSEIPNGFYIGSIEYPVADYDASNYQVRPAHTIMQEAMYSYYDIPYPQSYSVSLRLYDSILDAKAIFDKHNTMHTRTVINLSSSDIFGDGVFCHSSPQFTELNTGRQYYICSLRYKNLFVLIQGTITGQSHVDAHNMLRTIYNAALNYNPNRQNPVIGDSKPPLPTTSALPDVSIKSISAEKDSHMLYAVIVNGSQNSLTKPVRLQIKDLNSTKTWESEYFFSATSPLLPNGQATLNFTVLPKGNYQVKGTVDYQNIIAESNELNNSLGASVDVVVQSTGANTTPSEPSTAPAPSSELARLRERIKALSYTISQLEQQIIELETRLIQRIDTALTNRMKGRILLQVEEKGEAWYVDGVTGQKFYLKDGDTAYQALKAFGLGITNADIAKIPVGFEDRFNDADTDADGLADKIEEALGTDVNDPDTDGDGFNDGNEVRGNYNPLGSGVLARDTSLINRLKGKIVIQVEGKGQAWYIHPDDGKRYYLKDGSAAYQIMRFLSLGISNGDIRKIEVGSFE